MERALSGAQPGEIADPEGIGTTEVNVRTCRSQKVMLELNSTPPRPLPLGSPHPSGASYFVLLVGLWFAWGLDSAFWGGIAFSVLCPCWVASGKYSLSIFPAICLYLVCGSKF